MNRITYNKKIMFILLSLLIGITSVLFFIHSKVKPGIKPVIAAKKDIKLKRDLKLKRVTGVIIKAEVPKLTVYINKDSRIVKFKASEEICNQINDKINSLMDITYTSEEGKALNIVKAASAEMPCDITQ